MEAGPVMKYIRHKEHGFVVFPESITHKVIARAISAVPVVEILSAGFVDDDLVCSGRSESLNIASKPDDTAKLRRQIQGFYL